MSIYPVKITEWYDDAENAFNTERETLTWLLPYLKCLHCKTKMKTNWNTGYVHHSITFGYGDAWCSKECLQGKGLKPMTRKERDELNEMSLKVFGSSSRWQTIVNKGEKVYNKTMKYAEIKRVTVEEIKDIMVKHLAKPSMKDIQELIANSTSGKKEEVSDVSESTTKSE